MLTFKNAMLPLLAVICMMAVTGCNIGVKTERHVVFVSPVPIPESAKGTVMVATNRKVRLAIVGRKDFVFRQNVGGYVLVDPWFYDLLLQSYTNERNRHRGTDHR